MLRHLVGTGAAALLAILWLLALGAGAQFQAPLSYAVLALVLVTFWLTHVHRDRPRGWHFARLVLPERKWLIWGAAMALGLCGWRLLVALQFDAANDAATSSPSLWTVVAAIVAAPLIEEFGFRLWLQSQLERWLPALLAIVLASSLFTLVHDLDRWYLHATSGMLYGLGLWLSGSVWVPVFMHATSNAMLAALQSHSAASAWVDAAGRSAPHWLDETTIALSVALLVGAIGAILLAQRSSR
ncbi:MAG: CPBP family intramembrane glutamic endopeptidase [Pseudomonadales bacterium]